MKAACAALPGAVREELFLCVFQGCFEGGVGLGALLSPIIGAVMYEVMCSVS